MRSIDVIPRFNTLDDSKTIIVYSMNPALNESIGEASVSEWKFTNLTQEPRKP